jgi:hypothetical protein
MAVTNCRFPRSPPLLPTVIREAIADAPPKRVMLALSDLLQERLTHLVMIEPNREQMDTEQALPKLLS